MSSAGKERRNRCETGQYNKNYKGNATLCTLIKCKNTGTIHRKTKHLLCWCMCYLCLEGFISYLDAPVFIVLQKAASTLNYNKR